MLEQHAQRRAARDAELPLDQADGVLGRRGLVQDAPPATERKKAAAAGDGRSSTVGRPALSARATSDAVPGPSTPQATTTSLLRTLIALRASPMSVKTAMST